MSQDNSNSIELPIKKTTGNTLEERMSENAYERILPARYQRKNEEGEIVEDQEEVFERVAKNIALADALYEAQRQEKTITITPKNIKDNHSSRDELVEKVFGEKLPPEEAEGLETELTEHNIKHLSYDNLMPDLPEDIQEHVQNVKENYQEQMEYLKFVPNTPTIVNAGDELQMLAACFVDSPEDDMQDIHQTGEEAALIQQGGGGIGFGIWRLRPKGDTVGSSGGKSSGPISFMRTYDQISSTVQQGGVRRGAQMSVMRVSHPDVLEFIHSKDKDVSLAHELSLNDPDDFTHTSFKEALEEAREILDDYGGVPEHLRNAVEGHLSNFNISVGITDDFMQAVKNDEMYTFTNPRTNEPFIANEDTVEMYEMFNMGEYVEQGEVLSVPARKIWEHIIQGAHENGEPGVVYLERMNKQSSFDHKKHPEKRINSTNPCFTGDTRISTSEGLVKARELWKKHGKQKYGELDKDKMEIVIDSRLDEREDGLGDKLQPSSPIFKTGEKQVYKLKTKEGYNIKVTSDHEFMTKNRGWIKAEDLSENDKLLIQNTEGEFGDKGSYQLGVVLGWLVGDGHIKSNEERAVLNLYDKDKEIKDLLEDYVNTVVREPKNNKSYKISARKVEEKHREGSKYTIRSERLYELAEEYGLTENRLQVPNKIFKSSKETVQGFLQALFTADGTLNDVGSRNIRLASVSESLLYDVQRLLSNLRIHSNIYLERKSPNRHKKMPDGKGGKKEYKSRGYHDLCISKDNMVRFNQKIGFLREDKSEKLDKILESYSRGPMKEDFTARFEELEKLGEQPVFDLTQPQTNSLIGNNFNISNCGEEPLFEYDACNLSHVNLSTILDNDCSVQDYREFSDGRGGEDVEEVVGEYLEQVVDWGELEERVFWNTRFLDSVVTMCDYPIPEIEETTRKSRKIGLGVMGFAQLLVQMGIEYGSEEANEVARQLMNYINNESIRVSRDLAVNEEEPGMGRGVFEDWEKSKWSDPVEYDEWFESEYTDGSAEEFEDGFPIRNHTTTTLAPTGCVEEGSLVSTPEGLVEIDEFVDQGSDGDWNDVDRLVSSDDGNSHATRGYENGKSKIKRIETESGFQVSSTFNHKFRVVTDQGDYVWKRADEISKGDKVALKKNTTTIEDAGVELDTSERDNFTHNTKDGLSLPDKLTPELSELLGLYAGDGYVHDKVGVKIAVDSEKEELIDHIRSLSLSVFGVDVTIEDKGHVKMIAIGGRHVPRFFRDNGWDKEKGNNGEGAASAFVPSEVLRGGCENMKAFIRGLTEADGTAPRKVEICSTSEKMLSQTQKMLLSLGIVFKREKRKMSEEKKDERFGDRDMYVLRGVNRNEDVKFMDEIGLITQDELEVELTNNSYKNDDYPGKLVDELRSMDGYDNVDRSLKYTVNTAKGSGVLTRGVVERVFEQVEVDEESKISEFVNNFYLDEVTDVVEDKAYTLDIEVPRNRTYIANGFVSHNTTSQLGNTSGGCEPIYSVANFKNVSQDIQGEDMLVQFDDMFLRVLEANDINVEAVKEEAVEQMDNNEFDGVEGLESVPDRLGELFVTTQDLSAIEHAGVQCAFQEGVSSAISKCVEKGTLVQTDQGLVPIEDFSDNNPDEGEFVEADKGYTINGTDVISQYYAGKKESTKIRLDSGEEIVGATDSHKVMTSEGWKCLGDIKEGDVVVGRLEESHGDGGMSIDWNYERNDNPMHDVAMDRVSIPNKMTDNLAKLLGIYAADGGLTHGTYKFSISTNSEEIRDLSFNLIEEVFGIEPNVKEDNRFGEERDTVYDVYVNSKPVYQFVKDLCSYGSRNKRVPEHILQGSESEKKEFISGVTLDGYATDQAFVVYEGLSEDLAYHVAQLIRSFGKTHVYIGRKWVEKSDKYAYGVHVSNKAHDIVEPLESHKEVDKRTKRVKTCIPYGSLDETEFYSKSKSYSIIRNKKKRESDVMYKETAERIGLDSHDIAYEVTHVEDVGERELYDIEMEDDHEYLINGVISHNTINAPNDASVEDAMEAFEFVYDNGGKGVTYYRDGTRSKQVLTTRRQNKEFADLSEEELLDVIRDRIGGDSNGFVESLVDLVVEVAEGEDEQVLESVFEEFGGGVDESVSTEEGSVAMSLSEYRKRPDVLVGATRRKDVPTGDTLYVTLNEDEEGGLFEVFAEVGKSGGRISSLTEGLCRMISLLLRYGCPPDRIVKHLSDIKGPEVVWDNNGNRIHSIPDALAVAIEEHLDEGGAVGRIMEDRSEGLNQEASRELESEYEDCPDCGGQLVNTEGCLKCIDGCGWSKC